MELAQGNHFADSFGLVTDESEGYTVVTTIRNQEGNEVVGFDGQLTTVKLQFKAAKNMESAEVCAPCLSSAIPSPFLAARPLAPPAHPKPPAPPDRSTSPCQITSPLHCRPKPHSPCM